jgi:hypothetical protein
MGGHPGTGEWNHRACGSYVPRLAEKQLNSVIFQPWFVPRSTFLTIARLIPREYGMRMRDYFNRYGCMHCHTRTRQYGSNGMCGPCHSEVSRRLRRCWKRRLKLLNEQARKHQIRHIVTNAKNARELLQDLIPPKLPKRARRFPGNPAIDLIALAPRTQRSRS